MDGQLVLTDAVISNLTQLSLTNISLFDFATSNSDAARRSVSGQCKTHPGDELFPDATIWDVFNLLLGGALIKDVPLSSVCYDTWDNYDAAQCEYITEQWSNVSLHLATPSDVMYQLWEGSTCLPPGIDSNGPTGCTIGGFPNYIVSLFGNSAMILYLTEMPGQHHNCCSDPACSQLSSQPQSPLDYQKHWS